MLTTARLQNWDTIPDTDYSTPQQGLVIGANYPKPSRASKRFAPPIGIISSYCSDDKVASLRLNRWNVTKPSKGSQAIVGGTNYKKFVKSVYVTIQGVKYGWHMPLATAEGITAGELQRIGVKDVTEADKDEVVFGASVPTPPWAKVIKRTVDPNQNNAESFDYYTTFYDPSKANQIEASGGDFDWTHTKNGRYNPR